MQQIPQQIWTIRATVFGHLNVDGEPRPVHFTAQITATAAHIDAFLMPYTDREGCTLEVDLLDLIQPKIAPAETEYRWMRYIVDRAESAIAEKIKQAKMN